ncbi:hypothetical protein CEXT_2961 [Caerostris extrusa]|uniref:DDE-1 domain-containing protein n=1 Tax=Caerostris extrusa TaxID=172846 RepID=A0AAV4MGX5_CAEEX|nr:hypothetical protein CEXT_2961 [Caerostris extrusa]
MITIINTIISPSCTVSKREPLASVLFCVDAEEGTSRVPEINPSSNERNCDCHKDVILFSKWSEIVNAEKFCARFNTMHQKLQFKQPGWVNRNTVLLLRDTAKSHVLNNNYPEVHLICQVDGEPWLHSNLYFPSL